MTQQSTFTTQMSLQELKENHSIYLKALELLVKDGASLTETQDSVCWERLQRLNQAMPRRFLHPETIYQHLAPTSPNKRRRRKSANRN